MRGAATVRRGDAAAAVNRAKILVGTEQGSHDHLMWQWYEIAGHSVNNRYLGKVYEVMSRLWPGRADGAWVAITTPIGTEEGTSTAEQRLADFARGMTPRIEAAIDTVVAPPN